uniref:Putative reverse transcriptase domain-containing protein n=1 Tax=Tanacetum cinerariifolium TaxID=118510 RepID=A0A6L2LAM6_TANCI|nr:putative reverse transcriptase domain-containing protein [Tanacetum cinerariifolium]
MDECSWSSRSGLLGGDLAVLHLYNLQTYEFTIIIVDILKHVFSKGGPEEDPTDYPGNEGDDNDNESSDDEDDDDDVMKDEEEEEEEEHLALADPSVVPIDDLACITKFAAALPPSSPPPPENIKDECEEIEQVVAQQVINTIEAIAIYETKTNMAHKSMSQTKRQEDKVAENTSNKRKWEEVHAKKMSSLLAHVTIKETEDKLKDKRLEDVPIVQDFPKVYPEDLRGLPPTRQVKFQIDLIPGATTVA